VPPWPLPAASSYLEDAFCRWVLAPATKPGVVAHVHPQAPVTVGEHTYKVDYLLAGAEFRIAVELDGFAFHGDRAAFVYDRVRQNDLATTGLVVLRFSYDAVRLDTARCVQQLQALLSADPVLSAFVTPNPVVPIPEMTADPLFAAAPPPRPSHNASTSYFDSARHALSRAPLRDCQRDALAALTNYYAGAGKNAACVMSVGSGKTALGVAAALAFTGRRALIVTPGSVIRGTFDDALDPASPKNVLYALPAGPLLPGLKAPTVLTLDREDGPISGVTRDELLGADIVVTNFHSLGTGADPGDLLNKLKSDDIDFVVVDEAHIAAADSYQRLFAHFAEARTLLMSACFQRLDGRPIEADVVYRYRLIDAIADGSAKNLRIRRFTPDSGSTTYQIAWPDGRTDQLSGKDALLDVIGDERRLARITATSEEPIHRVMEVTRLALVEQAKLLHPIRPRVLFSALGQAHAAQIVRIAEQHGIPTASLHHSMTDLEIRQVRRRFESAAGDLDGVVQLKMLGQGYDFPPITVVVPMRPYGSFGEFYQFIGRGIRVLNDPVLVGRVPAADQYLDLIYHGELGLDDHLESIRTENEMDPIVFEEEPATSTTDNGTHSDGDDTVTPCEPDVFVLLEDGVVEHRVVHDRDRVEARRAEREKEALAQRYALYAASTANPATFEEFAKVIRSVHG
jgi:superfamily II DNA or RNA helicase/very-short-patch-repair endonuclease